MKNREFVSRATQSEVLKAGFHNVHLISACDCTTMQDVKLEFVDGKSQLVIAGNKTKSFPWVTPGEQVALHVGNDTGTIVFRLNFDAWMKAKNNPNMLKDERYTEKSGYILEQTAAGLERIPDQAGLLKCSRIIETFLHAITDGKEGVGYNLALESAIVNKTEFVIKVINDPYVDTETGEVMNGTQVTGFYAKSKFEMPKDKPVSNVPSELQA